MIKGFLIYGRAIPMKILLMLLILVAVLAAFPSPALAQTSACYWNGNVYYAGQFFFNSAGQQYICNADGTISYTGTTLGNPPYFPNYSYPSPTTYFYNNPNILYNPYTLQQYAQNYASLYPSTMSVEYSTPAITSPVSTVSYPILPYYAQQCKWAGIVYNPGARFCNSACQEYICNSDGTIAWTGITGGSTCPACVHVESYTAKK